MKDFQEEDLFAGQKKIKEEKKKDDAQLELGLDFSSEIQKKPKIHKLVAKEKDGAHKNIENAESEPSESEKPANQKPKHFAQNEAQTNLSSATIEKQEHDSDSFMKDKPTLEQNQQQEERPLSEGKKTLHELKELAKSQKINVQVQKPEPRSEKKEHSKELEKVYKQEMDSSPATQIQNSSSSQEKIPASRPSDGSHKFTSPTLLTKSSQHINKTAPKHMNVSEGASIGHILQEARSKIGLSQDQVAIQTKIKKSYIEALERDDFDHLPSMVYVKAYIRRLCQEYGIDEKVIEKAIKVHGKQNDSSVPDDVLIELEKSKQVNFEKQKRLQTVQIFLSSFIVVVIAMILILFYYYNKKKPGTSSANHFTIPAATKDTGVMEDKEMDRILREILINYPTGNITELEVPQK